MKKEYDFSKAKKNPYAAKLKKQISIRLDANIIEYFKDLAEEFDMPYQILMNLYLKECALDQKRPKLSWVNRSGKSEKK